jgi:hypothetical protein
MEGETDMQSSETDRSNDAASAVAEFEGAMRDVVHRDVAFWRRSRAEQPGEQTPESLANLIQRVSGNSIGEIDRLIAELQTMRDMLHNEGERVRRDIVSYAGLNQSTMLSMKVIAESLARMQPEPLQQTG